MTTILSLTPPSPVRPLRVAAGLFGLGACMSATLEVALPLSPMASIAATAACGVMAWWCWRRAARIAHEDHAAAQAARIVAPTSWRHDQLYLGDGCWWDQRHARRLQRTLMQPLERRADELLSGDPRIFGVLGSTATPFWVQEALANRHILIVGTTGVGKTKFMELLLAQAVASGAGVVVLDPKGDHGLMARQRGLPRGGPRPGLPAAGPRPSDGARHGDL